MTKQDTLRYAMDHLMDDGFVTATNCRTRFAKEAMWRIYDERANRGEYTSPSKLAELVKKAYDKAENDAKKAEIRRSKSPINKNRR